MNVIASLPESLRAICAIQDVVCQRCQFIQLDGSEAHPFQIVFREVGMAHFRSPLTLSLRATTTADSTELSMIGGPVTPNDENYPPGTEHSMIVGRGTPKDENRCMFHSSELPPAASRK